MNIAVVILNWNQPDLTIRCMNSVIEARHACPNLDVRIYVVDNNSSPQNQENLARQIANAKSDVRLVENPTNAGYSGGMNAGIRAAWKEFSPQYFWLLNNDLSVATNSLSALVSDITARTNVAVLGPTVEKYAEGKLECAGGYKYYSALGFARGVYVNRSVTQVQNLPERTLDYVSGVAPFIADAVLRRTGGLCEDYFMYYEELELARSLRNKEEMAWCRSAWVFHHGGASSGESASYRATYTAAISAYRYTLKYHVLFFSSVVTSRLLGLCIRQWILGKPGFPSAAFKAAVDIFKL